MGTTYNAKLNVLHLLYNLYIVGNANDKIELVNLGNDLDAKITTVPGMEDLLRRRDLPSFCRTNDLNDSIMQRVLKEEQELPKAHGLILNTFQHLEAPILNHIRTICPNLYPIGPLHSLHRSTMLSTHKTSQAYFSNSLWEEDRSCIAWLDMQTPKSVVYVSIGSLAVMSKEQFIEVWHGLVNSGNRFLWVQRLESVVTQENEEEYVIPAELCDATKDRGCVVSWVQQEEVLAHPSVGAFLTHSGWNSTLESIVQGVPLVCWAYFVDQQVNSRFVEKVWKVGVDMKDSCDRGCN